MTADAYLVLRCDAADETESDGFCCAEGSHPGRVANHTELRRHLKARGWRRTRAGEDLCPDHVPPAA